jgi:hypothetical protein
MASFVKVARLPNSFQAHLVAGRLEAMGIRAVAVDDHVEGMPAGTLLWVPEADAPRAMRTIAQGDDGGDEALAREDDAPAGVAREPAADRPRPAVPARDVASTPCPSCGSTDVDLLPRLLPFLPRRRRCLRCRTSLGRSR